VADALNPPPRDEPLNLETAKKVAAALRISRAMQRAPDWGGGAFSMLNKKPGAGPG
jgi:hypothetical protein